MNGNKNGKRNGNENGKEMRIWMGMRIMGMRMGKGVRMRIGMRMIWNEDEWKLCACAWLAQKCQLDFICFLRCKMLF